MFDYFFSRERPESFKVNEVIDGCQEALKMMPLGSRWMIYTPYELGYETRTVGKIKPYSTLIL
ncbi:FKBP-type peptidyl-prolyl cis-trans isomerase [Bacteroides luti]|uniref:FKBP-type peptidyl-prolyl cis-trans isomerase n=1 Tax=Bacteroides luti TaxID=1297750 RepID=UPI001FE886C8|nr:FKBP-type peptidyl-prolyl cis-trans isomerase [Bacteroides luti]